MTDLNTTVVGIENLTNSSSNATLINQTQDLIFEGVTKNLAGSYEIVGFIFLALFIYALYKARVSIDVGIAFMTPALFVFGQYGLLPGGSGTTYGLLLGISGLIIAGLFRYLR